MIGDHKVKTKNAGHPKHLKKAHPKHKDKLTETKGPQARTTSGIAHPHAKKVTKKGNPVGKGKTKVIAKRPTKTKAANHPVMGNSGKIAWKRFGM